MLASIPSATLLGVDGHAVTVEVHVANGLPGFTIVGLPDAACREARDRVRAALLSSGSPWPNQRITVNLAPSGVRKVGAGLDLAIAVGLLVARGELPPEAVDGIGVHRRARARRHAPARARHRAARRRARRSGPWSSPGALPPRRALRRPAHGPRRVARSPSWSTALQRRRAVARPPPTGAPAAADPAGARPGRRPRPAGRPLTPSRSPPPAATTCCWSARPARARRCSPGACPACCRRSTRDDALEATRVHSAAGVGRCRRRAGPPAAVPGAAPRCIERSRSSAAAPTPCGRARSAWRTAACCSSTSWASSPPTVLDALRQPLEEGVVRVAAAPCDVDLPGPVPARRGHEPVPVRRGRPARRVPLPRRGAGPLPPPAVGSAARPLRPARRGEPARRRRAAGRRDRRSRPGWSRRGSPTRDASEQPNVACGRTPSSAARCSTRSRRR